jgi:hypothetical protein
MCGHTGYVGLRRMYHAVQEGDGVDDDNTFAERKVCLRNVAGRLLLRVY